MSEPAAGVPNAANRSPTADAKAHGLLRQLVARRAQALGWWGRAVAALLTAGALAGAVTAIRALVTDSRDQGSISSGVVTAPVRLTEYVDETRLGTSDQRSLGNAAVTLLSATSTPSGDVSATGSASASPSPSSSSSSSASPDASATATASPDDDSTGPTILQEDLKVPAEIKLSPEERQEAWDRVRGQEALADYVLPGLADMDEPRIEDLNIVKSTRSEPLGKGGEPARPAEAALALAERYAQVRSVPSNGKRDLVGARVRVDVVLEGLEDEPVLLFWQLLPAGETPLPDGWWGASASHRLTASTASDAGTVTPWVPLPSTGGPYRLELLLAVEDGLAPLDSLTTEPFDL